MLIRGQPVLTAAVYVASRRLIITRLHAAAVNVKISMRIVKAQRAAPHHSRQQPGE
jgi:hypothetical protein